MIVYINYTSNIYDKTSKQSYYRFWYHGSYIDVKCSEQFTRGDIVRIASFSKEEIIIEKLANYEVTEKLPVLVFVVTRIPLDMNSNYSFYFLSKEDKILLQAKNIKNKNSSYLLVVLSKEDKSKIIGIDSITNNKLEFVIEE